MDRVSVPARVPGGPTLFFAVVCALAPSICLAQLPKPPSSPGDALVRVARELMVSIRYCAVLTIDDRGWPQARTVDPLPPDDHLVVWFATNPQTRKVAELRKDNRVTLHYFEAAKPDQGYVTLFGRARLVTDAGAKASHWKPEWAPFWPDRGEGLLLIEVTPDRLEIVSPARQINPDPATWKPQIVELGKRGVPSGGSSR